LKGKRAVSLYRSLTATVFLVERMKYVLKTTRIVPVNTALMERIA
jgi:hypothetical protein